MGCISQSVGRHFKTPIEYLGKSWMPVIIKVRTDCYLILHSKYQVAILTDELSPLKCCILGKDLEQTMLWKVKWSQNQNYRMVSNKMWKKNLANQPLLFCKLILPFLVLFSNMLPKQNEWLENWLLKYNLCFRLGRCFSVLESISALRSNKIDFKKRALFFLLLVMHTSKLLCRLWSSARIYSRTGNWQETRRPTTSVRPRNIVTVHTILGLGSSFRWMHL